MDVFFLEPQITIHRVRVENKDNTFLNFSLSLFSIWCDVKRHFLVS